MAIKIDLASSQYGIPFNAAYFRIVNAAISRTRNPTNRHVVLIDVAGYAAIPSDEETREIDFRRYHMPLADLEKLPGDTFLAKCYFWIMSQADMIDSVGV